jgi:hypothetical protein
MTETWLITKEFWETRNKLKATFISILSGDVPSGTMLEMTDRLYQKLCCDDMNFSQEEHAQHRYFSDGTPCRDTIACGRNPGIYTRRVYNIIIIPNEPSGYLLSRLLSFKHKSSKIEG